MSKSPNVLFFITHDVGRRFGCYGNEQAHTPNVDSLASESVLFEQHFCQWPLCGPARANLFTGCRPLTTRRFNNQPFFEPFRERMGPSFRSLPQQFREQGYETAAAGFVYHDAEDPPSWSLGHWRPKRSEMRADYAAGMKDGLPAGLRGDWQSEEAVALIHERWKQLQDAGFTEKDLEQPHIARRARGPAVDAADVPDEAYHGGQVTAHACEMLQSFSKDQPFFLALGFIDTHLPFWAPSKYWELYDRGSLTLPPFREPPENSPEWAMGDSEPAQYYTTHGYEEPWRASDAESLELLHGRYAVLSYFDALVGRVLSALEEAGHAENTIVVLTSDHGFHDGEHGYWGKHNVWDMSFRVPLIIRMPKAERQVGRVGGLTEHVDVYPGLCELAGVPKPEGFLEGTSLAPVVAQPRDDFKRAVFGHRKHMWHDRIQAYDIANTVRTDRYRLTQYLLESGEMLYEELFDYHDDPEERRNFATHPQYTTALREMRELLEAGWQDAGEVPARPS